MRRSALVRSDDPAQKTLEDTAKEPGAGPSVDLRELAEAQRERSERMRAQTRAVGEYVTSSPEARAFYDDWAAPTAEIGSLSG